MRLVSVPLRALDFYVGVLFDLVSKLFNVNWCPAIHVTVGYSRTSFSFGLFLVFRSLLLVLRATFELKSAGLIITLL